ncbi:hypothetical protein HMN09_00544400 [Mycena chlorophos]|uniref:Uncharacterized protein n=1 Tax=Mycena chlorophos TaxID=658473 RepID=A0A8H6TBN0_MYCCL|nr:hypothetical protein HMN09_00544400 [Mycena chlorophos]
MSSTTSSRLPPELEREIFEIAAQEYPGTAPAILRIARRVFIWIEPLIYRYIMTQHNADVRGVRYALPHKPAGYFEKHVRHLFLRVGEEDSDPEEMDELILSDDEGYALLTRCTNIESLWIAGVAGDAEARYIALVKRLPRIRKWCGGFIDMFRILRPQAGQPLAPFYQSLSHVMLLEDVLPPETLVGLALLPSLTHLCLSDEQEASSFRDALQQCRHLQLLIGVYYTLESAERWTNNPPVSDDRFVVYAKLTLDLWIDWETGLRGDVDMWVAAESFIARKKRREVSGFVVVEGR